jgi:hypothetical protein
MNFSTRLEIESLDGGDLPDISIIADEIVAILEEDGTRTDVLESLLDAFDSGNAMVDVTPGYLCVLLESIAELAPEGAFAARGMGESFRQTWVREFANGERVFAAGPWDEDD